MADSRRVVKIETYRGRLTGLARGRRSGGLKLSTGRIITTGALDTYNMGPIGFFRRVVRTVCGAAEPNRDRPCIQTPRRLVKAVPLVLPV
jgi:hypothetical protein